LICQKVKELVMFYEIMSDLKCDYCKKGHLKYNIEGTLKSYVSQESLSVNDISKIIDEALNEYIVFKCTSCGAMFKYTYKNLEKKVRKNLYSKLGYMIIMGEIREKYMNLTDKTLIYCGKCFGFDGKGACPVKMFETCKLKTLPVFD